MDIKKIKRDVYHIDDDKILLDIQRDPIIKFYFDDDDETNCWCLSDHELATFIIKERCINYHDFKNDDYFLSLTKSTYYFYDTIAKYLFIDIAEAS